MFLLASHLSVSTGFVVGKMAKFSEQRFQTFHLSTSQTLPESSTLMANRYHIQQKLGKGSFGTVYLVRDTKASETAERLKVLKEISIGGLKPNETVHASREAQLLAQLDHPAILKFYSSFLEKEAFCIITEYCEDRDLDWKLEEVRHTGGTLSEPQVCEWLCQLLLGVHYIHQRRILHRDLKAKNIFLKKNIVKIGDFGVSCLLMGSCDLATTFTGTPYYMSPEALSHRGYNSKSDMCCLAHAFQGQNFLSVIQKIVEGPTPSLPETYSPQLSSLMQRMLEKDSAIRISAAEALRSSFIEDSLQVRRCFGAAVQMICFKGEFKGRCIFAMFCQIKMDPGAHQTSGSRPPNRMKDKFSSASLQEQSIGGEREAFQILSVLQKKVHLETLQERSEQQKLSPRERMRIRKLKAADEKARKLKQYMTEKYQENHLLMLEYKSKNVHKVSVDVLKVQTEVVRGSPAAQTKLSKEPSEIMSHQSEMCRSLSEDHMPAIPEDPQAAEAFYCVDEFESCSEADSDGEHDSGGDLPTETSCQTCGQDSDLEALIRHMESVLDGDSEGEDKHIQEKPLLGCLEMGSINRSMAEDRIQRMRE
ncbi:hypothetical protein DNTS_030914 [Danionella cerebrum]|uniref:non-specific serine/threonine protein kinase n=1 Tax=Danionella cerebrum TaxID=2873325 RepID=A0A553Q7Z6_9TELE|nr:hypothetical protein DNTS_030914 [Danionella translucida]